MPVEISSVADDEVVVHDGTEMRVYDEATKAPTKRRSKKQSAG